MLIELFAILGSLISVISGIMTFLDFKRNNKIPNTYKIITYSVLLIGLPFLVYLNFEYRQDKKLNEIQSQYIIRDSEISSEIDKNYTLTFSGYLAKLSTIVGFYNRHENLYKEEYLKYKNLYEMYLGKYKEDYINKKGIIFYSDIEEIRSVVETGVSNIKAILQKNDIPFDKTRGQSEVILQKIILILFTTLFGLVLRDIYKLGKSRFIEKDIPKLLIKYNFKHRSTYGTSPRNYKFVNHLIIQNIDAIPFYDLEVYCKQCGSNDLIAKQEFLNPGEKLEKKDEIIIQYGDTGNVIEEAKKFLPESFKNPQIYAKFKSKEGKEFITELNQVKT